MATTVPILGIVVLSWLHFLMQVCGQESLLSPAFLGP